MCGQLLAIPGSLQLAVLAQNDQPVDDQPEAALAREGRTHDKRFNLGHVHQRVAHPEEEAVDHLEEPGVHHLLLPGVDGGRHGVVEVPVDVHPHLYRLLSVDLGT